MPDHITDFRGRYGFLSNFHPCPITWEHITYPSTEHAFNAGKSLDMGIRLWIADAPTPGEAKRRGRSVKLRPGWDERVRYLVMAEVLAVKFRDPVLAELLRATDDAILIESNTWHDNVWGLCVCGRRACEDVNARNANWLGRMLMYLRDHGLRSTPADVVRHAGDQPVAATRPDWI